MPTLVVVVLVVVVQTRIRGRRGTIVGGGKQFGQRCRVLRLRMVASSTAFLDLCEHLW